MIHWSSKCIQDKHDLTCQLKRLHEEVQIYKSEACHYREAFISYHDRWKELKVEHEALQEKYHKLEAQTKNEISVAQTDLVNLNEKFKKVVKQLEEYEKKRGLYKPATAYARRKKGKSEVN